MTGSPASSASPTVRSKCALSLGEGSQPELVDGQADRTSGGEVPEYLEHATLFVVPLDNRRYWYRYHHLFADLLRSRLERLHPEMVKVLHYATKAVERSAQNINAYLTVSSYWALSRIKQAQGHPAEAFEAIRTLRQLMEQQPIPWIHTLLPAVEAHLHLAQGQLAAASAWSLDPEWENKLLRPLPNSRAFIYAYEYGKMTELQILLARGRASAGHNLLCAVVAQLEHQRQAAQIAKLLWLQIKADVRLALAH